MATGARRSVVIAVLAVGETVRGVGLDHRHLEKERVVEAPNGYLEAGKELLKTARWYSQRRHGMVEPRPTLVPPAPSAQRLHSGIQMLWRTAQPVGRTQKLCLPSFCVCNDVTEK
jgi:hypothetical protein